MSNKPSEKPNKPNKSNKPDSGHGAKGGKGGAAQAAGTDTAARQTWPFAPGSQLGQQVAKPFAPKPSYRFNQR